jgi:hypothetical protein
VITILLLLIVLYLFRYLLIEVVVGTGMLLMYGVDLLFESLSSLFTVLSKLGRPLLLLRSTLSIIFLSFALVLGNLGKLLFLPFRLLLDQITHSMMVKFIFITVFLLFTFGGFMGGYADLVAFISAVLAFAPLPSPKAA